MGANWICSFNLRTMLLSYIWSQVPEFPSKLFFFCEVEPGSGGETPIVLSHIVYERMKEKYPEFVGRLEEHGLIYTRVLGDGDDPSSPIGRGWKSTFLTTDKRVAEERLVIWSFSPWMKWLRFICKQPFAALELEITSYQLLIAKLVAGLQS